MDLTDQDIPILAILLAYNCVRNTVIEDYHAAGKLSNDEMKAFNKEVVNKLYTALSYLFGEGDDIWVSRELLLKHWERTYPSDWDEPDVDPDIQAAIALGGIETLSFGGKA